MKGNLRDLALLFTLLNLLVACGGGGGGGGGKAEEDSDRTYYWVGGTVTGLATRDLVLQINGGNNLTLADYRTYFRFPTPLQDGNYYEVTIASQPTGQQCTLSNASGIVSGADNYDLTVACVSHYALGGRIAGLTGNGLTLQSNGGDDLALVEDGSFVFTTTLADGSAYEVTIASQPGSQTCRVANGSGIVTGSDIVNVSILCLSNEFQPLVSADLPKVLTLSWSDQGANHYKLLKNPDGISGYTQVGSDITDNQVHDEIAVHLTDWVNMSYIVQSCSADDVCVDSSPISPIPAMLDSIGYFKASNTGRWDFFGVSVALSADGNTMAISATGDDSPATGVDGDQLGDSSGSSGAVFLFVREGTSWRQQAYIKSSNSDMEDDFGGSLALSSNGDVLAVGALSEDSAAIGVNGNQADNSAEDSGAVYLFERSASSWTQQAYIKASNAGAEDAFGTVALSGDGNTLAVAAHLEDSAARGIHVSQANNSGSSSGAVYLFVRTEQGWNQQAYIKASNTDELDFFGSSIVLSDDGNTLAVGAMGEDSLAAGINGDQSDNTGDSSGAVYLFTRNAGWWEQQAYIKASNTDSTDFFGSDVAMSSDGNRLAIGALGEASSATGVDGEQMDNSAAWSGAVYIFDRDGSDWQQQAYIKASNTDERDEFGRNIALSADGTILAVTARFERSDAVGIGGDQGNMLTYYKGAAYLFTGEAGNWQQKNYIKAPVADNYQFFGDSLAISGDGLTLAVGVPNEDSSATGINGDRIDESVFKAGAVYLY
ncbi:MAG: FG-GAP repeat protein [Candidatus Thiodiazotropha endolucinida]